jgi:hypothetical protein
MVDNFEQIKSLLKFDNENEFYFLQIIQRKKDHKDSNFKLGISNNNRLIKAYYIFEVEQIDKYKTEIITLCETFNARAGICLNRRNSRKLSLEMMKLLADNISNNHFNQLGGLWNTVCGQYNHDTDKNLIIDIDDKNYDDYELLKFINNQQPVGKKLVSTIESKNGFHLIVKPFDLRTFSELFPLFEIHKNNPTILYIP